MVGWHLDQQMPTELVLTALEQALTLRQPAPGLGATRYQFVVQAGQLHYVGTWNFANENEPIFLNEKSLLDPVLQAEYPAASLAGAQVALPH